MYNPSKERDSSLNIQQWERTLFCKEIAAEVSVLNSQTESIHSLFPPVFK